MNNLNFQVVYIINFETLLRIFNKLLFKYYVAEMLYMDEHFGSFENIVNKYVCTSLCWELFQTVRAHKGTNTVLSPFGLPQQNAIN